MNNDDASQERFERLTEGREVEAPQDLNQYRVLMQMLSDWIKNQALTERALIITLFPQGGGPERMWIEW